MSSELRGSSASSSTQFAQRLTLEPCQPRKDRGKRRRKSLLLLRQGRCACGKGRHLWHPLHLVVAAAAEVRTEMLALEAAAEVGSELSVQVQLGPPNLVSGADALSRRIFHGEVLMVCSAAAAPELS